MDVVLTTQPIVNVIDAYGNNVADGTSVVLFLASGTVDALRGTLTRTTSGGTATFNDIGYNKVDEFSITATAGAAVVTSDLVDPLSAGIIDGFTLSADTPQVAGIAFPVSVSGAVDQYGNPASGTVVVSASTGGGNSPSTASPTYGTITVSEGLGSANTILVNAIATVLHGVVGSATDDTDSITVSAGVQTQITLTSDKDDIDANGEETATLTAQLKDVYGNNKPADGVSIVFSAPRGTVVTSPVLTDGSGQAVTTFNSGADENSGEVIVTAASVGLTSGTKTITFNDVTAPDAPVITTPGSSPVVINIANKSSKTLSGTAEAGSTVKIWVDGGATTVTTMTDESGDFAFTNTELQTAGVVSGTDYSVAKLVTVKATDAANNASSASNAISYTQDTLAPSITTYDKTNTVFSPNGDGTKDTTSFDLAFSEASVAYDINVLNSEGTKVRDLANGTAQDPDPKTWDGKNNSNTVVADGIYTIQVVMTDPAGNPATDISYNNVQVDTQSSAVALTYSADPAKAGAMTITATYSEPAVGTPQISIDQPGTTDISNADMSGSGTVWTYTYTVTAANGAEYVDGEATVSLSAVVDAAGNTAAGPTNETFTIDTTVPTASITSPLADAVVKHASGNVSLTFDSTGGATCEYKVGAGDYQELDGCDSPQTITLADGRNVITLKVTDAAENSAESDEVSFVVDTNDTLTVGVGADFATIQGAIDAATSGDTISIAAGTYIESLTVGKDISIVGSGATTVISPAVDQNGFFVTADGVTIQDLKITLQTSGADAQAVRLEGANSVTISGNTIETTGNKGIGIWVGGYGYDNSDDLIITNNTVTINDESTGIYAEGGSTAQSGWQITDNTITANNGNPIELYDVTNSTVSGNTLTTTSAGGSNVMWFAELSNLTNLVFSNNIVSGSSGSEVAIGTDFRNDGPFADSPAKSITTVTVSGNTFSNWGSRALRIGKFGLGTVTEVTVSGNKFMIGAQTTTLTNTDDSSVNAEANWWGAATGPVASTIVGTVDYRPWCIEEACTTVDTTAPTPVITSSAGSLTNDSPIPFSVAFGESVTGFEVGDVTVGNGTPSNFAGSDAAYTFDVTPTGEGAVTVDIAGSVAWDASGNYNAAATQYSITYDSVAPIAEITSGTPASLTSETTTDITVVGTGVVTYQYKLDGGSYSADTPIATHITLSGLADGAHALYVIGRDAAGNLQAEPGTATATWTVDTQEPILAITAPLADSSVNGSGEIAFTNDSDSTPTAAQCSINNSTWVACTSEAATLGDITGFGALEDTSFTLYLRDTDVAGNTGTTQVALVKDTSAPTVTSKNPGVNALSVDPTVDIVVTFSEAVVADAGGSNVTLQTEGDEPISVAVSGSGTATLTLNPDSTLESNSIYDVTLSGITDEAGNVLSDVTWSFTTATSYSIALEANAGGWNLISLPIKPTDTSVSAVLGSASTAIDAVWTYDPTNVNADEDNDGWFVYYPDDATHSSLSTMTTGYGYWVSMTADATISGSGSLLSAQQVPPSRTLASGWNLVGYYQLPAEASSNMTNAFSSIGLAGTDYTALWGFDNSSGGFKDVDVILPGDAFWISVPESGKNYTPSNL